MRYIFGISLILGNSLIKIWININCLKSHGLSKMSENVIMKLICIIKFSFYKYLIHLDLTWNNDKYPYIHNTVCIIIYTVLKLMGIKCELYQKIKKQKVWILW